MLVQIGQIEAAKAQSEPLNVARLLVANRRLCGCEDGLLQITHRLTATANFNGLVVQMILRLGCGSLLGNETSFCFLVGGSGTGTTWHG